MDRRRILLQKFGGGEGPTHNLPEGYEEVKWIEGNGSTYIDTGYRNVRKERFKAEAQITAIPNPRTAVVGSESFGCLVLEDGTADIAFISVMDGKFHVFDGYVDVNAGTRYQKCDGIGNSYGSTYFMSSYNILVFTNRTDRVRLHMKLKYLEITLNDTTHTLIPAIRKSDGVIGLYELEGAKMHVSAVSGKKFGAMKFDGTYIAPV